jgi:hypothetical protein
VGAELVPQVQLSRAVASDQEVVLFLFPTNLVTYSLCIRTMMKLAGCLLEGIRVEAADSPEPDVCVQVVRFSKSNNPEVVEL